MPNEPTRKNERRDASASNRLELKRSRGNAFGSNWSMHAYGKTSPNPSPNSGPTEKTVRSSRDSLLFLLPIANSGERTRGVAMDGGGGERARRARHDAIYGIFAEANSDYDSDDDGSRRRKRRREATEPDLSKPVRFVSTGYAVTEDIEPLPAMFGKISDGARARREEKERERDAAARRRQASSGKPAAPAPPGSVHSNTTVARIMKMMRYNPGMGLGKDGQGRTEPLEAISRSKNAGLGYVDRFKKPSMPEPAKENLPPPPARPPATKERQKRWSKKAGARKPPVSTKDALPAMMRDDEEHTAPAAVVQKVIDRRGPQERVLTDLRGLNDEQAEMEAAGDVPMPELQYNARLLFDDAAADVLSLRWQLRREQEKADSLAREQEKLSTQEAAQRRHLQVTETISGILERVRVDDAAGALTLEGLLLTFRDLKARFREEFEMCGVAWIACQFAHPLLMGLFHGWQPLEDPSVGLEAMSSWKDLLEEGDQPYDFSNGAASRAPYAQLAAEIIVPPVRVSGTNSWDARDPELMLEFLKAWERALPPVAVRLILEQVVMPKLSAAVESWDPRRESVPVHVWVHPWLPMLEQRNIETLCHSIRYKLSSVLHVWQAHDASAHALLSPWQNVFDSATWEGLMTRYIVPKLKMALQEFQINPADQKLDQFNWVMLWASTIPVHHMVHMLEVDFFSKWHQVLYHWLCSPNPDFNEIINWYKGWKGLFPPELLANERIRMLLTLGLDMMNRAAEGLEVVQPGTTENLEYLRGTEKRPIDAAPKESWLPSCHAVLGTTMTDDLSFKECIQAYAMEKGLLFMPRVGKFYNGMPVYEFGTVSICLDSVKRVVYAQLREGAERWSVVSLSQVLEMN
ncbi:unnamed protein product [Urochloa decumbens]|uniref:G-patch domain-containing protein n=1 Tax=Urochloa decumbens TaxID=240449 RepID=A0ABC8Z332_9POAL